VYCWTWGVKDREPDLIADGETLAEVLGWIGKHFGQHVRRKLPPPGTFIEILDWEQGVIWMTTRVG
jgi:hypothetical protein